MKTRKLLWAILFASLLMLLPSMVHRITNENNNKSVILAVNLEDGQAGNSGNSLKSIVEGKTANNLPDSIAGGMADLDASTLKQLKAAGISAFILPCEELFTKYQDTKNISPFFDKLTSYGFKIILQFANISHTDDFYNKLNLLVENYNIKYLLAYPGLQADVNKHPDPSINTGPLLKVIKNNSLIVFLMENEEQTGYYGMPGLNEVITRSDYRINRAFSIGSSLLKNTPPVEPAQVWLRSVVDRNIRLVVINPQDLDGLKQEDELNQLSGLNQEDPDGLSQLDTDAKSQSGEAAAAGKLKPVVQLQSLLTGKGFYVNTPVKALNSDTRSMFEFILLLINLATVTFLYITYLPYKAVNFLKLPQLFKNKQNTGKPTITAKSLIILYITVTIIIVYIILSINIDKGIIIAFTAALVYPSLTSQMVMKYLSSAAENNIKYLKKITYALLTLLSLCLAGASVVVSSMSDIRYQMHMINFNLVTPAYIIPLLLFALNYAACSKTTFSKKRLIEFTGGRSAVIIITYILFLISVLYLYLARNGNSGLAFTSGLELEARQLLENYLYARPRTKEFLIGYPCLFLFVYLYRTDRPTLLSFTTGLFSAITGVSIINSFCHGFTPALTSAARVGEGLLLGLISGTLALAAVKIIRLIFYRNQIK